MTFSKYYPRVIFTFRVPSAAPERPTAPQVQVPTSSLGKTDP